MSQATIIRDLSSYSSVGYCIKQAQKSAEQRKSEASKAGKMTISLIEFIGFKRKGKWNPEPISGWLYENEAFHISHESIYQYVCSDKKSSGNLFKNLGIKVKTYQSCSKDK